MLPEAAAGISNWGSPLGSKVSAGERGAGMQAQTSSAGLLGLLACPWYHQGALVAWPVSLTSLVFVLSERKRWDDWELSVFPLP